MTRIAPIILALASLSCVNTDGSELPDSSFIWTIRSVGWGQCNGVSAYMISGDTIIRDKVYNQILVTPDSIYSESNDSYFCAARDSSGCWFFIPAGDSIEYLLYNFDVSIGDIININNPWALGEVEALVVSKDSILIGEGYKTRIGIGVRPGELWEYWIEDIGSLHGLFYSCHFVFDMGYELSCTYNKGEFYYNFGFQDLCGCWVRTSVNDNVNDSQILIYPNPSNGIVNVNNQLHEFVILTFYSTEGKLIDEIVLYENDSKQVRINHIGNIVVRIEGDDINTTKIIQMIK